jgi:DmsE family decaheme c-type cytochrome
MTRASAFVVALLSCVALAWMGANTPSASQDAPKYVGAEACKDCHQTQWEGYQKTAHGRAAADQKVVADVVGCESCHGPGSQHVEAGGDKESPGFKTIRNPKALAPKDASAACLSCHKAGDQFYWEHSAHARKDVSCVSCHSIHASKDGGHARLLKAETVTALCITCHKSNHLAMGKSSHMPLGTSSMTCADCHNPHGSAGPRMIRATTTNDLCTNCHADKRGPFLWEHAPVRENCLTCHDAHASNNDKMLVARRPFLCQRCHSATGHPTSLRDSRDLAVGDIRLMNRSCSNCHSQIHGSNSPSGKVFMR